MQRVSALFPAWERSRPATNNGPPLNKSDKAGKTGKVLPTALDKVFGWTTAVPNRNRNSNSSTAAATSLTAPTCYGRETYWPQSLDRECQKAARILKSFCADGFLSEDGSSRPIHSTAPAPPVQRFSTMKIPPQIIQNAYGLAIFSCMRSGLWQTGSGGSGILIARKADGTWSPPAGILLQAAVLAFVAGVDIYDCVLVINNVAVLELFTQSRLVLGTDVSLAVGPLVTPGSTLVNMRWKELENHVLTYLKARGKHQGVPLHGCVVQERGNENHSFYDGHVSTLDILAGNISKTIPETRALFEVIKAAEGRSDFDQALMAALSEQPAPGDAIIESPDEMILSPLLSPQSTSFGIPNQADPDPYGVLALEMAGLEIREAGTRLRPTSSQFEYNPSPNSPRFSKFQRRSVDSYMSRSNRASVMSSRTQASAMTETGAQTDVGTPETALSHVNSEDGQDYSSSPRLPMVVGPEEPDYTKIDSSVIEQLSRPVSGEAVTKEPFFTKAPTTYATPFAVARGEWDSDAENEDDEDDEEQEGGEADEAEDEEEEAVVFEVATAAQPPRAAIQTATQATSVMHAKGALVNIVKRVPPPLPTRSAARNSRASKSDMGDVASLRSPLRASFQSADLRVENAMSAPNSAQEPTPAASRHSTRSPIVTLHQRTGSMASVPEYGRWTTTPPHTPVWQRDAQASPSTTTASSAEEDEDEREPRTPRPEDEDETDQGFYDAKSENLAATMHEANVVTVA